jgi:hypothetical protein
MQQMDRGVRWWCVRASIVLFAVLAACHPHPPSATPSADQSVADAMRLVCDAPARADRDRGDGTRSDKIAGHLSDGVGNPEVLTTVEGWKTDGIQRRELDGLLRKAKLTSCKLRAEAE